jgi:hypothetical protein
LYEEKRSLALTQRKQNLRFGLQEMAELTFLVCVHAPGEVPCFSILFFRFSFVLFQSPLVHHPRQEHDLTADRRLTGICNKKIKKSVFAD